MPKQDNRLHSVEALIKTQYIAPGTDGVVVGATATVSIVNDVEVNQDNTLYAMFVTQEQLKTSTDIDAKVGNVEITKTLMAAQNFTGAPNTQVTILNKENKRLLLVGMGNRPTLAAIRQSAGSITTDARGKKVDNIVVYITEAFVAQCVELDQTPVQNGLGVKNSTKGNIPTKPLNKDEVLDAVIRGLFTTNYQHDKYIKPVFTVKNFKVVVADAIDAAITKVAHNAVHAQESVTFAKEIGSLRYKDASNTYMKTQAETLAATHPDIFKIKIADKAQLAEQGYNLILAVNQGSTESCYIVGLEYTPQNFVANDENKNPIAFVGKTLTFDTGGLDLKPPAGMVDMHCDKLGGCNTLGLMRYLALTRPNTSRQIVGVLTITDNEIGPDAVHPHTIIETKCIAKEDGIISVAIDNTDAEGRLALADAVTFVQVEYKPCEITTQATLTGAVLFSLGHYATGLFTNFPGSEQQFIQEGLKTGEPFWHLPILPIQHQQLAGTDCDIKNITGINRWMGASAAAAFIETFVAEDVIFNHLDIAGSASKPSEKSGYEEPTGTPLSALINMVAKQ